MLKNKSINKKTKHKGKSISILFNKDGFSFCTQNSKNTFTKITTFTNKEENNWEKEVLYELHKQLIFKQEYNSINIGFITSFFNIVPSNYIQENTENLLDFSEADFDNNSIIQNKLNHKNTHVIYGVSQSIHNKLHELFSNINIFHSSKILIDSINEKEKTTVHINQTKNQLEVTVLEKEKLLFYNIFEVQTKEDILFYTLYILKQLELDENQTHVYTYGELLSQSKAYQMLKKYIRNILPGLKDENLLEHYLLYKLFECE